MNVLPDVLKPNLKVVFCGMAAGNKSAQRAEYYAGPGNQFWPVLCRVGLTPFQLKPNEFHKIVDFGIGLTDLVKSQAGGDSQISVSKEDASLLLSKIDRFSPTILAFNGKKPALKFLQYITGSFSTKSSNLTYGQQSRKIGQTSIIVLPSTSPAARGSWNILYWKKLADFINNR